MFRYLRNQIGLSLVEIMVASAAVGGLSLTIAKLMQNTNKSVKRSEIRNEYLHVQNRIIANLSDEISCFETLKNITIASGATSTVAEILRCQETEEVDHPLSATDPIFQNIKIRRCRAGASQAIYNSTSSYGGENFTVNFAFTITNLTAPSGSGTGTGVGEFEIGFRPTEKGERTSNLAPYEVKKAYEVIFEHDGSNLIKCYNNENNIVNTAIARACTGPNARLVGDINDSHNPLRCVHDVDTDARCGPNQVFDGYQIGNHSSTGEAQTLIPRCIALTEKSSGCGAGEYVVEMDDGSGVNLSCHSIPLCTSSEHLSRGSNGLLECKQITFNCPPNSVLSTRADGTVECKVCNEHEVLVRSTGGEWVCKSPAMACIDSRTNTQEYMVGVNADGTPMCRTLITQENPCEYGAKLTIKANGSIGTQCCPACSASETDNVCLGQSFVSSNGCGSICTGTKPIRNGTPGPWYVVPGRECSPWNHKRLERRPCYNAECGGDNNCSGYEMERETDCWLHNNQHTYAQCASNGGTIYQDGSTALCYYSGRVQGGRIGGESHNAEVNAQIIGSHGHVSCPAGWTGLSNYSSSSYFGCSCSRSRKTSCGSCAMPECDPAGVSGWWRQNRYSTETGYDARRTKSCFGSCSTRTSNFTCYPTMTERGCY